ncbi:MAG: hypothetical protein ACQEQZ_09425 [Pseudomonadota bacterium]
MKNLVIIIVTLVGLLGGTVSSPASHAAMVAGDTMAQSGSHECCTEGAQSLKQPMAADAKSDCQTDTSFCQHCEQHCAGQIGLVSGVLPYLAQLSEQVSSSTIAALAARNERLIRPPR